MEWAKHRVRPCIHAHDNQLEKLEEISANDSIGILYSVITLHLGFDFNSDEYKIMGLAPYGDPSRFRAFFRQAVTRLDDGRIRIPLLRLNQAREDRENYGATRRYLQDHLVPCRAPEAEITDEHRDVAAALQECLDEVILHLCGHAGRTTGLRRLALAGGVALNCTANGKLLQSGSFDEIYVQPAAGDDGSALGAALVEGLAKRSGPERANACSVSWALPHPRRKSTKRSRSFGTDIDSSSLLKSARNVLRGGQADSRWASDRLVPGKNGVWPSSARTSQHPCRSRRILRCATGSTPW